MNLLDLLLPDVCVLCETTLRPRPAYLLCTYCWQALPWQGNACHRCGLPLTDGDVCGACQQQPLISGRCHIPLVYNSAARHLVQRHKFAQGRREAHALAHSMLARLWLDQAQLPQAITYVPMTRLAQLRRGHNQAADLAVLLARFSGVPLVSLLRRQGGKPQREKSRSERQAMARRTFKPKCSTDLQHVALVDDVVTTGSTVRTAVHHLAQMGITRVDLWAAARAV